MARLKLPILLLAALLVGASASLAEEAAAAGQCPTIPPTVVLQGAQRIYVDAAGSIPDPDQIARQQEFIKPLRRLVAESAARVDQRPPDAAALQCAAALLSAWAGASALLGGRPNFAAVRDRARFAIGLNVVAFKLKAAGRPVSGDVVEWLRKLNSAVMSDFGRRPATDNLYVWSGVNAATLSLVTDDREATRYADQVWRDGIGQIDLRGLVPSELRRQGRATLYHNYYLSALLLLREIRRTHGKSPTEQDAEAIRRLSKLVCKSLSNSRVMQEFSGGYEQVTTPLQQLVLPAIFLAGSAEKSEADCRLTVDSKIDAPIGGDLVIFKEILDNSR